MFVHAFGAYFGLFMSLVHRNRNYDHPKSEDRQNSRVTSDHFSFLGTLILWVYWPSFNAYVLFGDNRHRAVVNTYLAMSASTVTALITSGFMTEYLLNTNSYKTIFVNPNKWHAPHVIRV